MFKRTFINVFRQMKGNMISTLINITGLSLGMACSFIILLYVIGEFNYEKNHVNRDQIYRVTNYEEEGAKYKWAINYALLPSTMLNEIPEVSKASILDARVNRPFYARTDGEYMLEKGTIYYINPDYMDIFTVPIIQGNPAHLVDNPGSIVISKEKAALYFGDQNPIGKSIFFQLEEDDIAFTVTGVMDKLTGNSAFQADFITQFDAKRNENLMGWDYVAFETYILVSPTVNIPLLEQKINTLGEKYHPEEKKIYELQKCKDIYLHSESTYGSYAKKGNILSILIFSGIGILILLIACINYIILATAESTLRYKEIGIKKVIGANRFGLISQIQMESLLISLLALPLALLIVERCKGLVSEYFGQDLILSYVDNWPFIIGFFGITLAVGSISGSYISLHLSRLKPIDIFSAQSPKKGSRSIFRKALIGFQLVIFIVLFTASIVIRKQINYALTVHPEFDLENLLIVENNQNHLSKFDVFKAELENHPDIERVSSSMLNILSRNRWENKVKTSRDTENSVHMEQYYVDKDYIETVNIALTAGISFNSEVSKNQSGVIINESGANLLGLSDPIGKTIITKTMFSDEQEYEIIGVVKDFISGTVHRKIGSFILFVRPEMIPATSISIRLRQPLSESGKKLIEDVWENLTEGMPMEMNYMDDLYRDLYQKEIIIARVITLFTALAILISSLGLFGLSLFVARRKNKEIGIRKVHGAQPVDIVKMILKEFILVIVLANCVALPISLFAMRKWLSVFAFKIKPDVGIFIMALLLSAFIVCATLTINALKAARMNPADSLRSE